MQLENDIFGAGLGVPWLVHEEGGNENEVVEVADFPDGAKMKERETKREFNRHCDRRRAR